MTSLFDAGLEGGAKRATDLREGLAIGEAAPRALGRATAAPDPSARKRSR